MEHLNAFDKVLARWWERGALDMPVCVLHRGRKIFVPFYVVVIFVLAMIHFVPLAGVAAFSEEVSPERMRAVLGISFSTMIYSIVLMTNGARVSKMSRRALAWTIFGTAHLTAATLGGMMIGFAIDHCTDSYTDERVFDMVSSIIFVVTATLPLARLLAAKSSRLTFDGEGKKKMLFARSFADAPSRPPIDGKQKKRV